MRAKGEIVGGAGVAKFSKPTTIKAVIHEEFGDGIMSATDFSMDMVHQPDPKGDPVNVVLSGKL